MNICGVYALDFMICYIIYEVRDDFSTDVLFLYV